MRPRPDNALLRAAVVLSLAALTSCGGDDGAGPPTDTGPDLTAVARVQVTPSSGAVNVGETLQLTASVTNVAGTALSNPVTWSTSSAAVATVDGGGLVTGVAEGSATITARAGGRSGTASVTVSDPRPPAAPTDLDASAFSHTAVDLTWTDNADNEASFHVEREVVSSSAPARAAAAAFVEVATLGSDVTAYRDTALVPETRYRYRVRAGNANGASDYTNTAEATTHPVLAVLTTTLAEGTANQPYADTLRASGGDGTYAWSLVEGALPVGLALSGAGVLAGTPTAPDSAELRFQVVSGGQTAELRTALVIHEQILPPQVVTDTLPSGVVGESYEATLEARRGDGTYVWALLSGTLPQGLQLDSAGTVRGTPVSAGTSTFTVQVTSADSVGSGDVTVTIHPKLVIATDSLPDATEGQAYAAQLEALGGDGAYVWTALSALPPGLALDSAGLLTGTPTAADTFALTFRVASGDGQSATDSLELRVIPALAITTTALADGQVGVSYSDTLRSQGGDGDVTWTLDSGALPAGLVLKAEGALEGTPTAVDTADVTVRATSEDGQTATAALRIAIGPGPVTVVTESLADGVVGSAYADTLRASGGDGVSYAWSIAAGALPSGLALDGGTGIISGTPTAADTATFTVEAASGGLTGSRQLTLEIADLPPVDITTTSLGAGTVGSAYSQTLTATGGNGSYTWSLTAGALPGGLGLGATSGVISGTPSAAGSFAFTVQAASGSRSDTASFTIDVAPAPAAGFQIELAYLSTVSDEHKQAFEDAKARWESIITADLPDEPGGLPECGTFHPATPGAVDDVIIYVTVDSIDGQFGTLGQAGPCYVRDATNLPLSGAMTFDEADLDFFFNQGRLGQIILHEMGHVLGIGSLWDDVALLSGDCLADPVFTGAGAIAAFDAAGGTSYAGAKVPVENTGSLNDGSNCSHWRETVLGSELMTPSLNPGLNELSAISIRSLEDMGYTVTTTPADAYALPAPGPVGARAPAAGLIHLGADVLPAPIYVVEPGGRIRQVRPPGRRR